MVKKLALALLISFSVVALSSCEDDNIENIWVYSLEGANIRIAAIQYRDGIFRLKDNKGAIDRRASWEYREATPNVIFITADIEEDIAYWDRVYFNDGAKDYLKANKAYFSLDERTMGLQIRQTQDGKDFIILMRHIFYRIENDEN